MESPPKECVRLHNLFREEKISHELLMKIKISLLTRWLLFTFCFFKKAFELCYQRDELQDWWSRSKSFDCIRSAIFHYFEFIQITFFNYPRSSMVTFQCQLDSSINANSAEPVTSCPLFQTWLNEPELDNPIHCQRFVSDKCTLSVKTFH